MDASWLTLIEPSGKSTTLEELRQFERKLDCPIPKDYIDFLLAVNGGKIVCEHSIPMSDYDIEFGYLHPFSEWNPGIGVKECRKIQLEEHLVVPRSIEIGSDFGGGCFYMMLNERDWGRIYFTFKDDVKMLTDEEWHQNSDKHSMELVADRFSDIPSIIREYQK